MKLYALIALSLAALAFAAPNDLEANLFGEIEAAATCTDSVQCVGNKDGLACVSNNGVGTKKCGCEDADDCSAGQYCKKSSGNSRGKCEEPICTADDVSECPDNKKYCLVDPTNPLNNECVRPPICTADDVSECPDNKKYCLVDPTNPLNNECVRPPKCTADDASGCPDNKEYCLVDPTNPLNNECVECLQGTATSAPLGCDNTTPGVYKICNNNNQCKNGPTCTALDQRKCTGSTPVCLENPDDSLNKCVECTDTKPCAIGFTCNANTCVPIACGAYDKCPTGLYCKRTAGVKSCVEGCKVKRSVCKTIDNKIGKCNGANKCIVPPKKRGSPCSTKITNDCGTGLKCVASYKNSYKGSCRKVVALGKTCGVGKFANVCDTGLKCKYKKCAAIVVAIP